MNTAPGILAFIVILIVGYICLRISLPSKRQNPGMAHKMSRKERLARLEAMQTSCDFYEDKPTKNAAPPAPPSRPWYEDMIPEGVLMRDWMDKKYGPGTYEREILNHPVGLDQAKHGERYGQRLG